MRFDWVDWLDRERQAAERRVGSADPNSVIEDGRYVEALRVWTRWTEARRAMAAARRAMADAQKAAQVSSAQRH